MDEIQDARSDHEAVYGWFPPAHESYRWLCTETTVMLGPYADDEIGAWLRGIATMAERGIPHPVVIRAADEESAARKLARKGRS